MALADDDLTVGKSHARNGEWADITIINLNNILSMDEDVDWQNYLKYINIYLKFIEEQRLNLLSKYNKMVFELNKCRDELLILKKAKLDAVSFQIQNTKLTKLNHALQEQLKEKKKINEKWLTSSKKVSQCISKQIPHQKKKVLRGSFTKLRGNAIDLSTLFSKKRPGLGIMKHTKPETQDSSNKSVSETVTVSETKILYCMVWKSKYHRTLDHEMYIASLKRNKNYKAQPYQYASSSKQILKEKAKPFPPCTHYGFNDHRLDDCRNYPECGICGSFDHFTSGHNHVIQIRGGERWSKDQHIELVNIIGDPGEGMLTRIVVRMEAIRIFLAFATYMNFKVYQMDVKSAFLNGKFKEEVYDKQPPGFGSNEFPDYVCMLDKAFYELKQAPRACSLVKTPMVPLNNLDHDLAGKPVNETSYRGMIRAVEMARRWWCGGDVEGGDDGSDDGDDVDGGGEGGWCSGGVGWWWPKVGRRPPKSGRNKSRWELDTQPLVLSTYVDVRAFLLSNDEAQESKEDILGAGEEMDEKPQAANIAKTHLRSPLPQADKPQSSHAPSTEASDTDSSCDDILKKYNNTLPLTKHQLVKYLRKVSNVLFARITEDNSSKHEEAAVIYVDVKASINEYYDENIAYRDQTSKLVEASMSSLDKSNNTISDLYKGFNTITKLLKEIKNPVKDDLVINKKISEATESFTKISTNITKVLSLVKGFNFSDLQSSVNALQAHALKQDEKLAA
nr:retrovirus-related Pol polyprotein from transposon TNT 1-94 [Tanacetum cinerariifolium]